MKIDFTKGISYWVELVDLFLSYVNEFWFLIFGTPLFAERNEPGILDDGTDIKTVTEGGVEG